MTRDSRKGWRYKLRTDANQRLRRSPEVRRAVEAFRRHHLEGATCSSRARTPHRGKLEVHHVGGLRPGRRPRLAWLCEFHNQRDAGNAQRRYGGRNGRY